jgi:hypothetical protein
VLRLILVVLVIAGGTAILSVITALNGYCGDSGYPESVCRFHVGGEVTMLAIWYALVSAMVVFAVRGLPRVPGLGGVVGGLVTLASVGVTWYLLIHATYLALDYWHHGGGGQTPAHDWHNLYWIAAVVAAAAPVVAYLAAGASRRAMRVLAYATAVSAASWLLALAWATYYYDRHF